MGIWKSLKAWLFAPSHRRVSSKHPDLYELDENAIAKEVNLHDEARRLGEAGLPSADATSPTGLELQLIQRVDKARLDYLDWANLRLGILNEDLSRHDVTPAVNRALQADKEFERAASTLLAEQAPIVRQLAETAARRREELDAFRHRHGLTRDAHSPQGGEKVLGYVVLVSLIVVEGLLNAFFFAQGLSTGLIGGFAEAATVAAANVLIAAVQGRTTVPFIVHHRLAAKVLGAAACVLALCLMVCISLGIGHYRDALVMDLTEPSRAALDSLIRTPFGLQDLRSWILFGVSMLFAAGALFDGFKLDDPYPGYGTVARRAAQAREDFQEEMISVREELEGLKADALSELDADAKGVQAMLVQQNSLILSKEAAQARLDTAMKNAQRCLATLLGLFRTENQVHRKGVAIPPYFKSVPNLPDLPVPDFGITVNRAAWAEQDGRVAELLAAMQQLRGAIQAAFNREFDRLQPLDAHFDASPTKLARMVQT